MRRKAKDFENAAAPDRAGPGDIKHIKVSQEESVCESGRDSADLGVFCMAEAHLRGDKEGSGARDHYDQLGPLSTGRHDGHSLVASHVLRACAQVDLGVAGWARLA